MKSLFGWNEKNRRNRERSLRLESLEDRMLLAVTAGDGAAVAALTADADPMATEAVKLAAPENLTGSCTALNKQTLTWSAVANATGYTINYRQIGGTSTAWKTKDVTSGSTTSILITGALSTSGYEYKIMAKGNGTTYTNSDFSEVVKCVASPYFSTEVTTLDDAAWSTTPSKITLRQAVYYASLTNRTVTFAQGLEGTIDLAQYGQIGLTEVKGAFSIDGDNRITVTNSNEEGRGRLFYIYEAEPAYFAETMTFKNITLSGADSTAYGGDGYFTEGEGNGFGAAIMFFGGYKTSFDANVVLDNVTVTDCISGGQSNVYFYGLNSFVMTNCNFYGNTGVNGGALYLGDVANATIADCTITENVATDAGGGLHLASVNATIDNTVISNNKVYAPTDGANLDGGGLYVSAGDYNNVCTVTLNNSFIENNYVGVDPEGEVTYARTAYGGAASVHNCNFTTNQCSITGNYATDTWEAEGGAVYYSNTDSYGYEQLGEQGHATVRFNQTYLCNNVAGSFELFDGAINIAKGGALFVNENLILVGCAVTGNEIRGNNSLVANAVYTFNNKNGASNFFCYYTTIAGNKTYSVKNGGTSIESGAIRDWGNSYYFGSVLIGNQVIKMNGTVDDTSDDTVEDVNFYTFALEENGAQLPRFICCAVDKDTMHYTDFDNPKWHYTLDLYSFGTYYDDAGYTQVSDSQAKNGGAYFKDENVQVDDVDAFFKDFDGGDYTLAADSTGIDAYNMQLYGGGFGYQYDIRGEGFDRVVNDIVDLGAYEFQGTKTFEVTVEGWTGTYDGQAHTVTLGNLQEGDIVSYSADGITYGSAVVSYTDPGSYTVYVKVERAGYEDFYGSGDIVINAATTKLSVRVVVSTTQASATEVANLPSSISSAKVGDTVYAQVWIKNVDGSELGCTGGYIDLLYSDANVSVGSYITSAIYAQEAAMYDTKTAGRVVDFGGCAASGVNDLAVSEWALLGTFSFTVSAAGTATINASAPTYKGKELVSLNLARSGQGNIKTSEIEFGSASFTVTGGGSEKLAAPTIKTGTKGVYVAYGCNRHQLTWSAVDHASNYEITYSADGKTWKTMTVSGTSAVVTGLTYGTNVQYKVRALGTGSYTDSDWSSAKTFNVCPMDINGDGDIAGSDRSLLASCWLTSEGDDEFIYACDINGDGDVAGADRNFLANNWLCEAGDEDLVYPKAKAADAAVAEFVSEFDIDLEVF